MLIKESNAWVREGKGRKERQTEKEKEPNPVTVLVNPMGGGGPNASSELFPVGLGCPDLRGRTSLRH